MRVNRTVQPGVFQPDEVVHPRTTQLDRASESLVEHPELLDMVDVCVAGSPGCGRRGLTCEAILRCAVLIHLMGYSCRELGFKLIDSASTKRFARIDPFKPPKKSALQSTISAMDATTWQAINEV